VDVEQVVIGLHFGPSCRRRHPVFDLSSSVGVSRGPPKIDVCCVKVRYFIKICIISVSQLLPLSHCLELKIPAISSSFT